MRSSLTRRLTPTGFALTALGLALPFVTVSCAPVGFGRTAPGGTANYSGLDLAVGAHPTVDKLLPLAQQQDDRLGVQLPALLLVLVVLGAAAATWLVRLQATRRRTAVVLAAIALVLLLAEQASATAVLRARLEQQLVGSSSAGKSAAGWVHAGKGFGLCLLLLVLLLAGNAIALVGRAWRNRSRQADRPPPTVALAPEPAGELITPADPWAATPIDPG